MNKLKTKIHNLYCYIILRLKGNSHYLAMWAVMEKGKRMNGFSVYKAPVQNTILIKTYQSLMFIRY